MGVSRERLASTGYLDPAIRDVGCALTIAHTPRVPLAPHDDERRLFLVHDFT
jgi:hypothetical protein